MTKKSFKPNVEEDLNRPHKVTLTEGQMSTILYIMEGYINPSDDYSYDPDFREDVDNIFEKLEGVADSWEGEFADPKVIQCESNNKSNVTYNEVDYVEQCITEGNDYRDCVDTLVDNMKSTK